MNEHGIRIQNFAEEEDSASRAAFVQASKSRLPHAVPRKNAGQIVPRRRFLQFAISSFGALGLWLMDRAAKRSSAIPEDRESTLSVPWNPAHGVYFHDRTIVVNTSSGTAVFSSICPHLGCRINRTEGSELVCPCHGSRFNLHGELVHGPAMRGLRPLPFTLDRTTAVLHVTLEN